MAETRMTAVIPKDRVGVLVGPGGTVKSTIEEKLFVDLKIDSPSGAVEIGVKPHAPDFGDVKNPVSVPGGLGVPKASIATSAPCRMTPRRQSSCAFSKASQ